MSIEEVIELGAGVYESSRQLVIWLLFPYFILVAVLFLTMRSKSNLISGIAFLMIILSTIAVTFATFKVDKFNESRVEKWKSEVANPYIESLPIEKRDVLYIKIDAKLSDGSEQSTIHTNSHRPGKTPVTISYKEEDGSITTLTDWVYTKMVLGEGNKPHLEFQRLAEDLGHGLNSGIHNLKVQLPKDYTFSEMK